MSHLSSPGRRTTACGAAAQSAELVESLSLREVGQRIAKLFLQEATGRENTDETSYSAKINPQPACGPHRDRREVVTRALFKIQSMGLVSIDGKT